MFDNAPLLASVLHKAGGATLALASVLAALQPAQAKQPAPTNVEAVSGRPTLMFGLYDLDTLGYQVSEHFFGGDAQAFVSDAPLASDGSWTVRPDAKASFRSRMVIAKPSDPAKFNGTVIVEWFNVTGGNDTPAVWYVAHRELLRRGYAYVGISAQSIGIEGGNAVMAPSKGLKGINPTRYGSLKHPGDAYSYDIFSQAGALLKASAKNGLLGNLKPRRFLAVGESQSAAFMTTYVNAIDPKAQVYDGYLVHSRFGSSSALDGVRGMATPASVPTFVRFRDKLRVPVLAYITETDLLGARLSGYLGARRKDGKNLRVWEVAGTSHADNYMFGGAFGDSGSMPIEQLAKVFRPTRRTPVGELDKPGNPGMVHHYSLQASIVALDNWVSNGRAPASTQPLVAGTGADGQPQITVDTLGIAKGGIRTPWTDVPSMTLSGTGNSGNFVAILAGRGEMLDKAALAKLYPGGKSEYLSRFEASLNAAIKSGYILREDRDEIMNVASINFDAAP